MGLWRQKAQSPEAGWGAQKGCSQPPLPPHLLNIFQKCLQKETSVLFGQDCSALISSAPAVSQVGVWDPVSSKRDVIPTV